jgi:hypothetical protein
MSKLVTMAAFTERWTEEPFFMAKLWLVTLISQSRSTEGKREGRSNRNFYLRLQTTANRMDLRTPAVRERQRKRPEWKCGLTGNTSGTQYCISSRPNPTKPNQTAFSYRLVPINIQPCLNPLCLAVSSSSRCFNFSPLVPWLNLLRPSRLTSPSSQSVEDIPIHSPNLSSHYLALSTSRHRTTSSPIPINCTETAKTTIECSTLNPKICPPHSESSNHVAKKSEVAINLRHNPLPPHFRHLLIISSQRTTFLLKTTSLTH